MLVSDPAGHAVEAGATHGRALFSREGLIALMKKLPLQDVRKSRREVLASVYNVDRAETEFIRLNGLSKTDMMDCLLASSAIPGGFASVKMRGERYIDGEIPLLCEIPVLPLADAGFRRVLVVSLDSHFSLYGSSLQKEFPKVQFEFIAPLDSLEGWRMVRWIFPRPGCGTG